MQMQKRGSKGPSSFFRLYGSKINDDLMMQLHHHLHAIIICSCCAAVECNICISCYIVHFDQCSQFAFPLAHLELLTLLDTLRPSICALDSPTSMVPHMHLEPLTLLDTLGVTLDMPTSMVPFVYLQPLTLLDTLGVTLDTPTSMVPQVHLEHLNICIPLYTLLYTPLYTPYDCILVAIGTHEQCKSITEIGSR